MLDRWTPAIRVPMAQNGPACVTPASRCMLPYVDLSWKTAPERSEIWCTPFNRFLDFLRVDYLFFIGKSQPFLRKSMDLLVYKVCIQILGLIYIIYMYIYITLYICIYIYKTFTHPSIVCLFGRSSILCQGFASGYWPSCCAAPKCLGFSCCLAISGTDWLEVPTIEKRPM